MLLAWLVVCGCTTPGVTLKCRVFPADLHVDAPLPNETPRTT